MASIPQSTVSRRKSLADRFWPKVDKRGHDECWNWKATTNGRYGLLEPRVYAHRLSWELANGPIPDGLWIDHRCGNPLCVNPNHLQLVTPKQNCYESTTKTTAVKTHCLRGHDFKLAKVFYRKNGYRYRKCLICEKQNREARVIEKRGHLGKRLKLNRQQASEIRSMYKIGKLSQTAIGKLYGVSNQTISNIVTGKQSYSKNGLLISDHKKWLRAHGVNPLSHGIHL